mmetsp:Transcript_12363/g.19833  ORF Transcript_12363/g.19833 Transcript_12363/m.19833 type:complete len:646 (+) Transcript_12363:3-1940(+)
MIDQGIKPNVIIYNNLIKAFSRVGDWNQALYYLRRMKLDNLQPDTQSFNSAIDACANGEQLFYAEETLRMMKEAKVPMDRITFNSMIKAYTSVKAWQSALEIFNEMEFAGLAPDIHTYNSVINCCIEAKEYQKSEEVFRNMKIQPDVVTITTLLHSCGNLERVGKVFQFLDMFEHYGIQPDQQVFGAALNACVNADASADVAMSVLERAKNSGLEPNAVSLSSLVHLMSKNGRIKEAEDFIDQMADSDIPATVESYNVCIDACTAVPLIKGASVTERLFGAMLKNGIEPDLITYNTMLKLYSEDGNTHRLMGLFSELRAAGIKPSINTYNSIFKGCLQCRKYDQLWSTYEEMKKDGVIPSRSTVDIFLQVSCAQGEAKKAAEYLDLVSTMHPPTMSQYTAILNACCSPLDSNAPLAYSILQQIRRSGRVPYLESYNKVLSACVLKQDLGIAIRTLFQMKAGGQIFSDQTETLIKQIFTPDLWSMTQTAEGLQQKTAEKSLDLFVHTFTSKLKDATLSASTLPSRSSSTKALLSQYFYEKTLLPSLLADKRTAIAANEMLKRKGNWDVFEEEKDAASHSSSSKSKRGSLKNMMTGDDTVDHSVVLLQQKKNVVDDDDDDDDMTTRAVAQKNTSSKLGGADTTSVLL